MVNLQFFLSLVDTFSFLMRSDPIAEVEEDVGEREYHPEGNPFNDEQGEFQNRDQQHHCIAGGEPIRDLPVPELSSAGFQKSQTPDEGWGHSPIILQTQAPYQSQTESQSQ